MDPARTFPASDDATDAMIFLREDITDPQRRELDASVRSDRWVRGVRFENRQQAYDRFIGAPADAELEATIRPLADEGFDGPHDRVADWHVITLLVFNGGDRTFSISDAGFDQADLTFSLDGSFLSTTRTAAKRVLEFAGGSHDLSVHVIFPGDDPSDLEITFHVDPIGSGACL